MNATQEHEKGPLLQGYSPWRVGGEQTLLSITQSLAVVSGLLAVANVTGSLSGSAIFNQKNPIFINLNLKSVRNSTYDKIHN